jgi:hypothetical protein
MLFVFVPLLLSNTMAQPNNREAPYLYYYSTEQGAFIIERADGTDSTVLTNIDALPDGHWILRPGWSSS